MVRKVVSIVRLAAQALANLKINDPIRMAAATAFFSFFALPAIVIILSQVYGQLLHGHNGQVSWQLFHKLAGLFGNQSARQLQDISQHLQQPRSSSLLTALSVLVLLLASTTLFAIIKNSLNQIWSVKPTADRRFWHVLIDKVIALGIIIFSGFLLIGLGTIRQALHFLNERVLHDTLTYDWSRSTVTHSLSVLVLMVWFAIVFKYLPDIQIRWRAVWVGALVTAVLVEGGEQVLDRLLIQSPVSTLYGASGAIILILLFVFYASLIFYYGASFTRCYAEWIHLEAQPGAHAVAYQITEVDSEELPAAE